MAVPTLITELSTTAASNPPSGSESTAEGDNNLRASYSFIAQLHSEKAPKASPTFTGVPAAPTAAVDTNTTQIATTAYVVGQAYAKLASPTFSGTLTAAALTTTGNTILGNAQADTLNVGNGDLIKDGSGNFSFGTSDVQGKVTLYYDRSSQQGLAIKPNADTGPGLAILFQRNDQTGVGSISTTDTATAYSTSSDYRLKNISGDLQSSGAFIDALQPRVGTWKASGSPFVGFVAHELQAVSPTSVTGEKDGEQMQAVGYGSAELIANMVAELKALRARVAALEA